MKPSWIAIIVFCAFFRTANVPAAEIDWTVYLSKAGPLNIGMSIAEVRRMLHDEKAILISWEDPVSDDCDCSYLESAKKPRELCLMFQNGYLVRFDVHEPGIRTAGGAEI